MISIHAHAHAMLDHVTSEVLANGIVSKSWPENFGQRLQVDTPISNL